jgi:hypothetical protein
MYCYYCCYSCCLINQIFFVRDYIYTKMKKIQLNLKKKDRATLKHMSNTYEDTHMKESSKLEMENNVNPDVFLMNLQLKNKNNEHLFNMDFSEFLPTVQKKEEITSIQEQEPSHLMRDIVFDDSDINSDAFSFLDKLDNIDKNPEKRQIERPRQRTLTNGSKHSTISKRSYSKDSKQSFSIIKEESKPTTPISNISFQKKFEPMNTKSISKSISKPIQPIFKKTPEPITNPIRKLNNTNVDDFKNQLLKLNSHKTQTLNRFKNTYFQNNRNRNHISKPISNPISKPISKNRPSLQLDTTHIIPDDPIFKEPLLNNYTKPKPKLTSPKYIPPPKTYYERPLSPTHIEFPHEKEMNEQERMELETQYTQVLPKGNSNKSYISKPISKPTIHISNPISKPISNPISKPISNPISKPTIHISKPISKPSINKNNEISKKKMSYKSALYKVLKRNNKINNKTNINIPKKVLKDLYRFSNKIDINYSI